MSLSLSGLTLYAPKEAHSRIFVTGGYCFARGATNCVQKKRATRGGELVLHALLHAHLTVHNIVRIRYYTCEDTQQAPPLIPGE